MHFFSKPRSEQSKLNALRPIAIPAKVFTDLDRDLRVVRDCIRSAQQAMHEHKRRKNIKLVRHWQNMLAILRDSERDLLAIKDDWQRLRPQ